MNKINSEKFSQLSFFAILCIIFFHGYNIDRPMAGNSISFADSPATFFIQLFFSKGLAEIGLPLFFVKSGFFLFRSLQRFELKWEYWQYSMKKRMRTIVLPYLLWSAAWILFYIIVQSIPFFQQSFYKETFLSKGLIEQLKILTLDPIPFQFWYLRHLLLFTAIFPLFYYSIKYSGAIVPIVVLIIWLTTDSFLIFRVQDIFFFIMGSYFSINNKKLPEFSAKTTLVLFLIWITGTGIDTYFILLSPDSIYPFVFRKVLIALGVLVIWLLFDFVPKKVGNYFIKGASFTFFVYALHEPLLTIVVRTLTRIHPYNELYYTNIFFISSILTSIISVLIGVFVRRYFNPVFKLLSGGR